jgi:hypothetical protein
MYIGRIAVYLGSSPDVVEARALALNTLRQALDLLKTRQPRRLARLERDVPRVILQQTSSSGYLATPNAILLAVTELEREDAALTAATLVHEATHARIELAGIAAWPRLRSRIEQRCLREQIDFLTCVPGREDLVRYYRDWLGREWWTSRQVSERRVRHFEMQRAPRIVISLLRLLSRFH